MTTANQPLGLLQVGDILVVNYTDVGWSPYFPMLSGLVTEIGGLLSHGAVVAREYGLPCIVNVQSATTFLQTGQNLTLACLAVCVVGWFSGLELKLRPNSHKGIALSLVRIRGWSGETKIRDTDYSGHGPPS